MNNAINLNSIRYFSIILLIGFIVAVIYFNKINISQNEDSSVSIGGKFALTNQDGVLMSNADFSTDYLLIFFGFTHCHGVCPAGMNNITKALNELDKSLLAKVTPVFITIDPDRDSPEVIKEYLANFHTKFIGLTGNQEEIKFIVKNYGVYSSQLDSSGDSDYQLDHSAYIYLTKKDGGYIGHSFYDVETSKLLEFLSKNLN